MDEEAIDKLMDAASDVLGIAIEPEWKAGIKANLRGTLRLAALVDEFELPDETEPAPVFEA